MTPRFDFTVEGLAAPKGSAKAFQDWTTGRVVVHADNRDVLKRWEHDVRVTALAVPGRERLHGPVAITVSFILPRPRSVSIRKRPYPSVKPDLSKLLRGLEDGLTGVLYDDDAQIVQAVISKRYAAPDETPCAQVSLYPLEGGR